MDGIPDKLMNMALYGNEIDSIEYGQINTG
jgi:hypothetical protein